VDGYAVKGADTFGASESLPVYLKIIGEVPMGSSPGFQVNASTCALIHTGGMIPKGADAVVMVEHTQEARQGEVEVLRAVGIGENVIQVGEDVALGQVVVLAGTKLRPAEIGGLMALGVTHVDVVRKPRVGIISSGDEVIPPEEELRPGQVKDINSYTLSALVEQAGGIAILYGIVSDQFEAMRRVVDQAISECDLIIITAGSSASTRDLTSDVINSFGEPGVLVHGVNVRPGKPTILALSRGKPVIGLPGNPVSALVIAGLFVVPVLNHLQGIGGPKVLATVQAKLRVNLVSQSGREDWIPVRLVQGEEGWEAEPIFGKSNLIFTLARADGMISIPATATGLDAGKVVDVHLSR
jgi:molybdopterin molybdotransferase